MSAPHAEQRSAVATAPSVRHSSGQVDVKVDVAVCIVEHNARPDLEACLIRLAEVWPERISRAVTVVVNTDQEKTAEYVRQTWPDIRVVENAQPLGFGANVNQAAVVPARYLLIMNPDVLLDKGAVDALVAFLDAHRDAGACGPKTFYPNGRLQPTSRRFPNWGTVFWRWLKLDRLWQPQFYRRFLMSDWDHESRQPVDWVMASCVLVRADAFRAIGGFDPGFFLYYEDIDLCRRLWRAGYSVYYLPEATVIHKYQRHSAASFVNPLTWVHLRSIFRYRSKHGLAFGQFSNHSMWARVTILLAMTDLILTQLALQIARYLRLWFPIFGAFPYPGPSPLKPAVYLMTPVIWLVVFGLLGLHSAHHVRNLRREVGKLLAGVFLSGLVFAGSLYAFFLYEIYVPRLLLAYFLVVDFVLLAAARVGLRDLFSRNGLFYKPRTLIVGTGKVAQRLSSAIGGDVHADMDLIANLSWREVETHVGAKSPMEYLSERVAALQIDEVILTPHIGPPALVHEVAGALKAVGAGIRIVPHGFDSATDDYEIAPLYEFVTLRLRPTPTSKLEQWLRRWLGAA